MAEPVKAFVFSINRVVGLAAMPRDFFVTGAQVYLNLIQFNIEQKKLAPPACYTVRQMHRFSDEFLKYFRENRFRNLAVSSVQEAVEFTVNAVQKCLTLMSTQVTVAWTSFEALAGDLWEDAINVHPKTLATKASQARMGEQKPSISFDRLGEFSFNVANVMGTLLRQFRNNPFQTLQQIAETYQYTFPKGPNVSRKDFWKDKDLLAVSLLRNVIAHRAGLADDAFIEKAKGDPRLAHFEEGKEIRLDGALVSELLTELCTFAEKMIRSVDNWIATN